MDNKTRMFNINMLTENFVNTTSLLPDQKLSVTASMKTCIIANLSAPSSPIFIRVVDKKTPGDKYFFSMLPVTTGM